MLLPVAHMKLMSEPVGAWYVRDVYTHKGRPQCEVILGLKAPISMPWTWEQRSNVRAHSNSQRVAITQAEIHMLSLSYTHKIEHQVMQCPYL